MANWVTGYPVSDREIDLMYENECARIWERLNAPDEYEQQMKNAAIDMRCAVGDVGTTKAIYYLMDAQGELEGTPMADEIQSFIERLEDIECDIRLLAEKFERGERG